MKYMKYVNTAKRIFVIFCLTVSVIE